RDTLDLTFKSNLQAKPTDKQSEHECLYTLRMFRSQDKRHGMNFL
ncbi:20827_t:CDS:1, partial [Racocetra persica]